MNTQTTTQPSRLSDLDAIFPGERTVEIADGITVRMKPIPLRMVSTFLGTFIKLGAFASTSGGLNMDSVLEEIGDQAVELLQSSMVDGDLDALPMTAAPDLFKVLLEMNFSPAVLEKWGGLLQSLTGAVQGQQEPAQKTQKKRSKNSKRT